jgi:hypothetical protein
MEVDRPPAPPANPAGRQYREEPREHDQVDLVRHELRRDALGPVGRGDSLGGNDRGRNSMGPRPVERAGPGPVGKEKDDPYPVGLGTKGFGQSLEGRPLARGEDRDAEGGSHAENERRG